MSSPSRDADPSPQAGYREGITDGKLSTLQQGFDVGFARAVTPSRRLGNLRGRIAGLIGYLQSLPAPGNDEGLLHRAREVRTLLGRVKRGDVCEADEEALAHAREEHPDPDEEVRSGRVDAGGDWSVSAGVGERREMERLVDALDGLGGGGEGVRQGEVLDEFEERVGALEREAGL